MSEKKENGLPPEVGISITDRVVLEQEALQALREDGQVPVPETTLSRLETLGIYAKGVGAVKMQGGRILLKQQRLDRVMLLAIKKLEQITGPEYKSKQQIAEISKLMESIATITNADTRIQELAVEMARATSATGRLPDMPEEPEQKAFLPNKPVRIAVVGQQVHLHTDEK